jgi:CheY-like chemotaxis protein
MDKRLTTTFAPVVWDEIVEGSPQIEEAEEPRNPIRTTSMPVIKTGKGAPAAETGLAPLVIVDQFEGRDDAEAQDARLTTDETQVETAPQKVPENMTPYASTVLIIEDTQELAEVIQATLERMGIRTQHETHGSKALARFHDLRPDVVLLDIGLPDMSGWKFLEAIKNNQHDNLPVIIVITAYGDPANRLVGKFQNVFDYLIKPFTSDEVERVVASALKTRTA